MNQRVIHSVILQVYKNHVLSSIVQATRIIQFVLIPNRLLGYQQVSLKMLYLPREHQEYGRPMLRNKKFRSSRHKEYGRPMSCNTSKVQWMQASSLFEFICMCLVAVI